MLARQYLDLGGAPTDETFQHLFLAGKVRFGFARASGAYPIPLSARSCKYDGGFVKDGGHGMLDLLLTGTEERRCNQSQCHKQSTISMGYWDPAAWRRVVVSTRLITRTAIDPASGTARTGQLYSQRVLEEGQTFFATSKSLRSLPSARASGTARVYRTVWDGEQPRTGMGGGQQCEHSCALLGQCSRRFQQFLQREGKAVLVVTLLSDGMFRDAYLREATAPTISDLASLGIQPDEWQQHPSRAFMDTRTVFGFDGDPSACRASHVWQ